MDFEFLDSLYFSLMENSNKNVKALFNLLRIPPKGKLH